jgi:hypothetical protein
MDERAILERERALAELYAVADQVDTGGSPRIRTAEDARAALIRAGLPDHYRVFPRAGALDGILGIENTETGADWLICWERRLTEAQLLRTVEAWRQAGEPWAQTAERLTTVEGIPAWADWQITDDTKQVEVEWLRPWPVSAP